MAYQPVAVIDHSCYLTRSSWTGKNIHKLLTSLALSTALAAAVLDARSSNLFAQSGPNVTTQPLSPLSGPAPEPKQNAPGSVNDPLVVRVLPNVRSIDELAQDAEESREKAWSDKWLVWLTGAVVVVGVVQCVVFYVQARRLKQTIDTMKTISRDQSTDVRDSINQATRAATAMENVASSMEVNVGIVRAVAQTSSDIAAQQNRLWPLQMRAYIAVNVGGAVYQDERNRFEGKALLVNTGNTPAYKLRHEINAAVLPIPIARDHVFDIIVPPDGPTTVVSQGQNRILSHVIDKQFPAEEVEQIKRGDARALYLWGKVTYEDVFGVGHYTNFCHALIWRSDGSVMGYIIPNHGQSD